MAAPETKTPAGGPGLADAVHLESVNTSQCGAFIHISQPVDAVILLALMRTAVAGLRREISAIEYDLRSIEEVGVVLKAGRVSPAGAVAWLRSNDVAHLVLREATDERV